MTIIKPFREFKVDQLTLDKVRTTKTGNNYFTIKYPKGEDWVLQTPRCKLIFKPEFSLSLWVILDFEDFIREFDEFLHSSMAKGLNKELKDIPYSDLLRVFGQEHDFIHHDDPSHKHSVDYIRLNVTDKTDFFEDIKDKDGVTREEHLENHKAMSSLKVGDEVKCLIQFKQGQIKKSRSTGERVASVQLSLLQVKITDRYH